MSIYKPDVYEQYPDFEHGHMFPSKIKQEFVYDDKFEYRVTSKIRKFKRFFVELILNLIAPILVFFRFNPHITNKKVFKEHKDEIKNGLMTISNHVFPWDNVVLRTLRPFKRMEMPIWKEGAESTSGEMYRLAGGIPVPFTMRGLYHLMNAMDEVIKDKGWLHVYPEAACWEYYCPIRDFKEGSFKIAVDNKIPVFPIAFSFRKATGIFKLWKKNHPLINISIGEPLYANEKLEEKEAIKDLCSRVKEQVILLAGFSSIEENEQFKKQYKYYKYTNPYNEQYNALRNKTSNEILY